LEEGRKDLKKTMSLDLPSPTKTKKKHKARSKRVRKGIGRGSIKDNLQSIRRSEKFISRASAHRENNDFFQRDRCVAKVNSDMPKKGGDRPAAPHSRSVRRT